MNLNTQLFPYRAPLFFGETLNASPSSAVKSDILYAYECEPLYVCIEDNRDAQLYHEFITWGWDATIKVVQKLLDPQSNILPLEDWKLIHATTCVMGVESDIEGNRVIVKPVSSLMNE